ncbi:MAG: transcription-repair coupling factor, partial [Paludibacteraceae bacterium]|nr:transcription-repair coupling factor [Paludibacteraceae bacterium]
ISLYRELDSLRSEAELTAYTSRLIDRFGPLPQEAQELLEVVRLRWLCCRLGIEKIFLKGEQMTLYFTTHNPSYWQSDTFGTLLNFLLSRSERCRLVEEKNRQTNLPTGRRYAVVRDVRTISGAIFFLTKAMA